jgi:hypothetical protein
VRLLKQKPNRLFEHLKPTGCSLGICDPMAMCELFDTMGKFSCGYPRLDISPQQFTDETPILLEMKNTLVILLFFCIAHAFSDNSEEKIVLEGDPNLVPQLESDYKFGCPAADEFKLIMTGLRKSGEFKDNEARMRDIAFKVSNGCAGASTRFFEAFKFLKSMELTGDQSMSIAVELANKDDQYLKVFKEVMIRALDPKQLALDIRGAVLLAQELSIYFEGDPTKALRDFVYLTDFCSDPKEIALSKPRCIDIAIRVLKLTPPAEENLANLQGKPSEEISAARAFVDGYKFLKSVGSHVGEALMISYDIVKISPYAFKNFKAGYEFGSEKSGLDLSARGSVQFAMEMARRTVPGGGEVELQRLPASEKSRAIKQKANSANN